MLCGPRTAPGKGQVYITRPRNRKAMTASNGTMITLMEKSRKALAAAHATALAAGGKDKGKPGPRTAGGDSHYAYLRDLDGNMICLSCPAKR